MFVHSVSFKGSKVKIKYELNNGDMLTIATEDKPDTDFSDALEGLAPVLVKALQITDPEGMVQANAARVSAYGLVCNSTDSGTTYRIQGQWFIPDGRSYADIESPVLKEPGYSDFFEKRVPEKFPAYLTPFDLERIDRVLDATNRFINGARAQKEFNFSDGENGSGNGLFQAAGALPEPENQNSGEMKMLPGDVENVEEEEFVDFEDDDFEDDVMEFL